MNLQPLQPMFPQADLQKSIEAQNGFRFINPIVTNRLKAHFINREHMTRDEIAEELELVKLEQNLSVHYVFELEKYSL